jgi:GAF domain-containing protein
MSDATGKTQHETLLQSLHQASRLIAIAKDEADASQALIDFVASTDAHVARLLLFTDFVDGRPTHVEMREGWTVDSRPAQPYGTRLLLADYPILEFMNPETIAISEDVKTDKRLNETARAMMALSGVGSFVIVPLTVGPNWPGALFVGRNTPSIYAEELVYAWWTLSSQLAAALEHIRLLAQEARYHTQLEWLALMEATLSQATNEEEILTAISFGVELEYPVDRIVFQYLDIDQDDQPKTLRTVAAWHDGLIVPDDPGLGQDYAIQDLPLSRLWLNEPEHTVFVSDIDTDPRADELMREQAAQLGFRAMALMPLYSGNRWQGLVTFFWPQSHTFSTEERYHLQELSKPASALVASRRAYLTQQQARHESERRATQLQVATQVSRAVNSILDPGELIQQVVDLVCQGFNLYYAGLFLVDQSGEWTGKPGRWAVLRAGTGQAGQQMVAQGHKLEASPTPRRASPLTWVRKPYASTTHCCPRRAPRWRCR